MIPRDRLLLAGAALIALTGVARSARADEEGKLAAAVREASAPDDKKKAAVALAAKKSPSARKNLEQLLGDESDAWTQEAALHGLVLLGDAAADERAVEFVEAHFTSADHVVEAVKTRKSFTIAALSKRYAKTEGFQARSSFVKIASAVRTKESDAFLRDAIAAK
ncbi:MAG: hypothetical protein ACAI25_16460, partial [Planctomycetota bacterium]